MSKLPHGWTGVEASHLSIETFFIRQAKERVFYAIMNKNIKINKTNISTEVYSSKKRGCTTTKTAAAAAVRRIHSSTAAAIELL